MKRRVEAVRAPAPHTLYRDVRAVLESARSSAYRSVNTAMVLAYWHVGRLIVEHEQEGRSRAGYGEALIVKLASRLTRDLGRGFDERNLWYMRSFFEAFPIVNALRSQSPRAASRSAARKGAVRLHDDLPTVPSLRSELSWTH